MDTINTVLSLVLFLSCTMFLVIVLKDMLEARFKTLGFVYLVFYVFFVLPVILDIASGGASLRYETYNSDVEDPVISFIAMSFIVFVSCVYFVFYVKSTPAKIIISMASKRVKICVLVFLVLTVVSMFFMIFMYSSIGMYMDYGRVVATYDPGLRNVHNSVAALARIGIVISAAYFLLISRPRLSSIIWFLLFATLFCWVGAKRSFIAYAFFSLIICLIVRGEVRRKSVFFLICCVTVAVLGVMANYQSVVRGQGGNAHEVSAYGSYVSDFSRLQHLRHEIGAELYDTSILPYRGASLLFTGAFYVPRSIWPNKPYPYAVYYTNSVLGYSESKDPVFNWGLTTNIYGEMLSNLSWIGFLICPFIIAWLARNNDKNNNNLNRLLVVFMLMLVQVVHFAAFSYVFVVYLLLVLYQNLCKHRVHIRD